MDGAADTLLAERARMTLDHGSPNTIAPMLEAWFAGLAPRLGVARARRARRGGRSGAADAAVPSPGGPVGQALSLARGEAVRLTVR